MGRVRGTPGAVRRGRAVEGFGVVFWTVWCRVARLVRELVVVVSLVSVGEVLRGGAGLELDLHCGGEVAFCRDGGEDVVGGGGEVEHE